MTKTMRKDKSSIPLPINLFQILDCRFGGEGVEDKPIAAHSFGKGR